MVSFLVAMTHHRAVGRGGAGGARVPPIILTGPLWNNCTIVCELAMPPENTNSQYNTITNCYKTTSWASTHAGPANWNLHLGSRFCANMFQKCRKLLLRELQFSKFSGGAYPLETKLLNILYMYMPLFSNWAGPPQKILSCYGPASIADFINPEYKRPVWKVPPSEHETVSQLSRMESYIATMSWAVGTCASNQQLTSVFRLLRMHMPDVNEGANSVDYLKKVFTQTEGQEFEVIEHDYCHKCKRLFLGEEEECLAASCNG